MTKSDQELDRLSALLNELPPETMPMTLSELDGYMTGILACSDIISPSEWLPRVWGETGEANFPTKKAAAETIDAVMKHYNSVAETMIHSFRADPIYEVDPNSDETLWEPWIEGFTSAMSLRPETWDRFIDQADEETKAALIFFLALQDINQGRSEFSADEVDKIDLEAPAMIPECVTMILLQSRPELFGPRPANLSHMPFKAGPRPGRNSPCSCGSGHKYKQCCGKS